MLIYNPYCQNIGTTPDKQVPYATEWQLFSGFSLNNLLRERSEPLNQFAD
jgi:hypothetical protein